MQNFLKNSLQFFLATSLTVAASSFSAAAYAATPTQDTLRLTLITDIRESDGPSLGLVELMDPMENTESQCRYTGEIKFTPHKSKLPIDDSKMLGDRWIWITTMSCMNGNFMVDEPVNMHVSLLPGYSYPRGSTLLANAIWSSLPRKK